MGFHFLDGPGGPDFPSTASKIHVWAMHIPSKSTALIHSGEFVNYGDEDQFISARHAGGMSLPHWPIEPALMCEVTVYVTFETHAYTEATEAAATNRWLPCSFNIQLGDDNNFGEFGPVELESRAKAFMSRLMWTRPFGMRRRAEDAADGAIRAALQGLM